MSYELRKKADGSGLWINDTAGEALGQFKVVYIGPAGTWLLADADALATMPAIGLTLEAIAAGSKGRVLKIGVIVELSWTWVPGGLIYVDTVAGELTQTAPTGTDDQRQAVAVAMEGGSTIMFDPGLGSLDAIGMLGYEETVEPIHEPAITQKGNGHAVLQYYTDGQNRSFLWGVTNDLWRGVELL